MNSAMELKVEYASVSHAVRFDGDDGIDEQRRALEALLCRCESTKGLREAVKQEKRHIEAMEQEYSMSAPETYASVSGGQGRGDRFRHGNFCGQAYMTVNDFAAYYSQGRQGTPNASGALRATETVTAKDCTDSGVILCRTPSEKKRKLENKENMPLVARVEKMAREWFEPDDRVVVHHEKKKGFPFSMVACFVIIAVSLMMLVSGTVMVAGAKSDVSELKHEVAQLSDQAQLLQDRMESEINYLEVYRIATEEYGMVDADFVRGTYLGRDAQNYIEVYEKPDDTQTAFATLLAAIGIHIGD
jgi:hypothetical protein